MALVYIEDNDPWIVEHDACEKLFRDVMELVTQRDHLAKNSQMYASVSADIRFKTNQYTGQVRQLRDKIDEALRQGVVTSDEAERRIRQVERLRSNMVQLERRRDVRTSSTSSAFADAGTTGWGIEEEDDEQPLDVRVSVADLKTQNRATLQDQEQGLDELYKVITRQKAIAQTINTEVDHQNEIIEDLADHMDRVDERLIDGTRNVRNINRKDRTCGYWIVILLLFISIIAVAVT